MEMENALLRSGSNSPMFRRPPQTWARDTSPPVGPSPATSLSDRNDLHPWELRAGGSHVVSHEERHVRHGKRVDARALRARPLLDVSDRCQEVVWPFAGRNRSGPK